MEEGFIKIYRSIEDWEWYSDSYVVHVWIHLLLNANWEDKRFRGKVIPRGSLTTSYPKIARDLNMSRSTVIRAINKLKKTGEITAKTNNQYTHIFINKYDKYQSLQYTSETTHDTTVGTTGDTTGDTTPDTTPETLTKNIRIKEVKNKRNIFTPPSREEVATYCRERGNRVDPDEWYDFYDSKGWMVGKNKMVNWKAAVRTWEHDRKNSPKATVKVPDYIADQEQGKYEDDKPLW